MRVCIISFIFCMKLFLISSQITVKTTNTSLNLRSEPTTSSKVLYSIPNGSQLLYDNNWSDGWIKVVYSNRPSYEIGNEAKLIEVSGWVNLNYVEDNFFKSSILSPLLSEEISGSGCFWGVNSAFGILGFEDMESSNSVFKFKVNNEIHSLNQVESNSNFTKWESSQIKLEFFGATTDHGHESSSAKGVLRIEYNGKVEYIFASLGGGC